MSLFIAMLTNTLRPPTFEGKPRGHYLMSSEDALDGSQQCTKCKKELPLDKFRWSMKYKRPMLMCTDCYDKNAPGLRKGSKKQDLSKCRLCGAAKNPDEQLGGQRRGICRTCFNERYNKAAYARRARARAKAEAEFQAS